MKNTDTLPMLHYSNKGYLIITITLDDLDTKDTTVSQITPPGVINNTKTWNKKYLDCHNCAIEPVFSRKLENILMLFRNPNQK